MATFNTKQVTSHDVALDSTDTKTVIAAALKIWADANGPERTYLLAKATARAIRTKEFSARSLADKVGKSRATVGNYLATFTLAETAGEPDITLVAAVYTIVANVNAPELKAWVATLPEDPAERREAILAADYTTLKAEPKARGTKGPQPKGDESEETDEPEVSAPKASTANDYMVVMQALVGKVKAGEFTAEESAKFHRLADELRRASESAIAATATGRTKVAA